MINELKIVPSQIDDTRISVDGRKCEGRERRKLLAGKLREESQNGISDDNNTLSMQKYSYHSQERCNARHNSDNTATKRNKMTVRHSNEWYEFRHKMNVTDISCINDLIISSRAI